MEVAHKARFITCDTEIEELNISCHTNSSGCDYDAMLDISEESELIECPSRTKGASGFTSTISNLPLPRRLFSSMDCDENESSQTQSTIEGSINNNKYPTNNHSGINFANKN